MSLLTLSKPMSDAAPLVYRSDLNGALNFYNETFMTVTGYTAEELQGKPLNLLRHPDTPRAIFADLWQSLNQGRPWMGIVRSRRKDGSDLWIDLYILPVFDGDRHVGYGALAHELSAGQIEQQMSRYQAVSGRAGWGLRQRRLMMAMLPWLGASAITSATLYLVSATPLEIALSLLPLSVLYGVHLVLQRGHLRKLLNESPNAFASPLSAYLYTGDSSPAAQTSIAMRSILMRLQTALIRIGIAGDQVEQRAKESAELVAAEAQRLDSQRVETQQAAAAISQMSSTIQEVAANVQATAKAAGQAETEATEGYRLSANNLQSMQQLSDAVGEITTSISTLSDSSTAIVSVIEVINAIAEQTNLLALNAAIEAARAGEAGRGFAVVADEVRSLALRTRGSTGQIEQLIGKLRNNTEGAVQSAEKGKLVTATCAQDVQQVGLRLTGISKSVSAICAMSQQMATAVEQQSHVIEDINRQVVHIAELSERSAQSAQYGAHNSQQLTEQAESLRRLAIGFNQ
ncbi:methyl-accepting chemotaxis protein [Pseudomonas viridiflava]|nr:methyl-accepting chemotaxis protein [Pseudomonas viridiflava]